MIIGIDIDDTVGDFTEELFPYAYEYDKNLRNKGIINEEKYIYKGMFDWSLEETSYFEKKYIHLAAQKMKPKKDVCEVIQKLKDEGFIIKFISARNYNHFNDPFDITYQWLKQNNIKYDKLIVQSSDKIKTCIEERVDIFVDDIASICEKLTNVGIKCYLFDSKFNKKYSNDKIKRINSWNSFYEEINWR